MRVACSIITPSCLLNLMQTSGTSCARRVLLPPLPDRPYGITCCPVSLGAVNPPTLSVPAPHSKASVRLHPLPRYDVIKYRSMSDEYLFLGCNLCSTRASMLLFTVSWPTDDVIDGSLSEGYHSSRMSSLICAISLGAYPSFLTVSLRGWSIIPSILSMHPKFISSADHSDLSRHLQSKLMPRLMESALLDQAMLSKDIALDLTYLSLPFSISSILRI